MDFSRDYYKILGIPESATKEEIKRAFRRLAKKYHPDVNPGNEEAEKKFKEINEAHDVLSDESKKAQYDAVKRGAFSSGGFEGFSGFDYPGGRGMSFDLGDIFGDIFGRSGHGEWGPTRGRDLVIRAELSFLEAAKGTERELSYRRRVECPDCGGVGIQAGARSTCATCGGSGRMKRGGGILGIAQPCESCRGAGFTGSPCGSCIGAGMKDVSERIKVKIPPGASRGTKVRVAGKGEMGRAGGGSGDLYLEVEVGAHRFFKREGFDIFMEVPLNYSEAVLGATIEVPTIDGTVKVKIPPGTESGKKIRLKGKGAYKSGGGRGDQYVVVRVVLPRNQDEAYRRLVKEMAKWEDNDIRSRYSE
ncbi:MAG: molecular chaperone DnaJ [Deltaproteobacteria bacterium]|nr:molecular chaperone DnaJ [Deltaproteobacteria bacterium]NIS77473.1 molecular chaperone DnaJ [Deltaproteobacteria bacterium]